MKFGPSSTDKTMHTHEAMIMGYCYLSSMKYSHVLTMFIH